MGTWMVIMVIDYGGCLWIVVMGYGSVRRDLARCESFEL